MKAICFYFQVHQPLRLRNYRFFEMGLTHNYYDDYQNKYLINRIADRCYLPMNELILELIEKYGKDFKVSFSISGVALDQFEWYAPHVIESFKKLAKTGNVEFLAETNGHSLASITNIDEFKKQVEDHSERIKKLFGKAPKTFRNTELIYSDEIGDIVQKMGFDTMLTEGAKHILGWKSPNYVYGNAINKKLKLLLRNYQLSDDISFRFSNQAWDGWPLTTEKYVDWILELGEKEEVVNLFMDYETFGEHQWKETGIFDFFRALPNEIFKRTSFKFYTPSEVSKASEIKAPLLVPFPISWADEERDLTAWLGNELQNEAFEKLYELADTVSKIKDKEIQKDWRFLQTSDHFYYMCTKWLASAEVHKYFSHYPSPYEAFINYMNILSDFIIRLKSKDKTTLNKIITNPKKENMETKKPAAKKPAAKKPAAKKPAAKKTVKKAAPKKAAAKPAAKKAAPKKATKPAVKKAAAPKKAAAKKTVAKKATKPAVKKAAAPKKAVAKKAAPKKPAVKKAAPKKPAVKKATTKK